MKLNSGLFEHLNRCRENKILLNELDEDLIQMFVQHKIIVNQCEDDDYLLKLQFDEDQATYSVSTLGLVLVPTLGCNFDCDYCFETGKRACTMKDEIIENLIPFIKQHEGIKDYRITWYGGEPLLALKVIKQILVKLEKEIPLPLKGHSIVTNGYYFTKEAVNLFKKYPLDQIQITLDGNKERHNRIRKLKSTGEGSYDTILNNIDAILKELPDTQVNIRVNIEKKNMQDYYDLQCELLSRWKGYKVGVHPGFLRIDNETGTNLACSAIDRWEAHEFAFKLYKKTKQINYVYPQLFNVRGCCATVVNSYIIGPEGEIYKCWNDVSDNSKVVGYIDNEKLVNLSLFYRYMIGSKWYHNQDCLRCFYLPICRGTCAYYRLRNQHENGEYTLCQCLQKTPEMLDQSLEYWYYNQKQ